MSIAAKLKGAKGGPFPEINRPWTYYPRDAAPTGDGWVHEIKFDGYRLQAMLLCDRRCMLEGAPVVA